MDEPAVGGKADQDTCAVEHDSPEHAVEGEGQSDAFINVWDIEPLPLAAEGPAWLHYHVFDASPAGNVRYWASAWDEAVEEGSNEVDLEVCQYFTCDDVDPALIEGACRSPSAEEDDGVEVYVADSIEVDGHTYAGCCARGGNGVEILIEDPQCPGARHGAMDGYVLVSVDEPDASVCRPEMHIGIDVD